MKVKENVEEKPKQKFEPFSFTVGVQTEDELVELYYRFYFETSSLLRLCDTLAIPPKYNFHGNNSRDVRKFLTEKVNSLDIEY